MKTLHSPRTPMHIFSCCRHCHNYNLVGKLDLTQTSPKNNLWIFLCVPTVLVHNNQGHHILTRKSYSALQQHWEIRNQL